MNPKRETTSHENASVPDPATGETGHDPEHRDATDQREHEGKDKMMDKTLADSYPASDPPSTIPDPSEEDSLDADKDKKRKDKAA
jgi:hypothetical protein